MFPNFNKLFKNKFNIMIILSIILIFIGISIYYYNHFVKPKLNQIYVDNKEFVNKKEKNSDPSTLYFFYTTWCPHCKVAKPHWKNLKEKTGGVVKETKIIFKEIDCDTDTDTAEQFKIEGYPTIKLVHNNKIYNYDAKPNTDTLYQFLNSVIN